MPIDTKPIDQIDENDLQELIGQERERKTFEFKRELNLTQNSDKIKFLSQVSSFANTSGGHLIYGINEANGVAKEVTGFECDNLDKLGLTINNLIRNSLKPRLVPIPEIQAITLANGKAALVIRIHRSYVAPHQITLEEHFKFYGRNSNGRFAMDVDELRIAFDLTQSFNERVNSFRFDRVAAISAQETPAKLCTRTVAVFHLIPFSAFNPTEQIDVKCMDTREMQRPLNDFGYKTRFNLEGFLLYKSAPNRRELAESYVQFFRSGAIEIVFTDVAGPSGSRHYELVIASEVFCRDIIKALNGGLATLKTLNIPPPYVIALTLINANGAAITGPNYDFGESELIDRTPLFLPSEVVENPDLNADQILRPLFDSLYHACGYSGCDLYDQNGKWKGRL